MNIKRSNPDDLANFDENTKRCVMNCGPHKDDPRTSKERKYQCDDCETVTQIIEKENGTFMNNNKPDRYVVTIRTELPEANWRSITTGEIKSTTADDDDGIVFIAIGYSDEFGKVLLYDYMGESKADVEAIILEKTRKEGFKGNIHERLEELNWRIGKFSCREIDD